MGKPNERSRVFLLTFFSYASYHASRKVFSAIKTELQQEQYFHSIISPTATQVQLDGLVDTLFLLFYSFGLFLSGYIGERINSRVLLTHGMVLSAICIGLMGIGGLLQIHVFEYYAVLSAYNGAVQSTGWPANVAIMGRWFAQEERGTIMGFWSANASFGNILGTGIAVWTCRIVGDVVGWKLSLCIVAGAVVVEAILVHKYLQPAPKCEVNELSESKDDVASDAPFLEPTAATPIRFWKAWCIPGVLSYALAYACLKSVNYALFFWLPLYLSDSLHMDESRADAYSMFYDLGQIVGGFMIGYMSDKLPSRSHVAILLVFGASLSIHLLSDATEQTLVVYLIYLGLIVGGPANLISTAISIDLGTDPSLQGNSIALSTVTGIIDGTGSIGAAIAQFSIGYLANCHTEPSGCDPKSEACEIVCSWQAVIHFLSILCICTVFCLFPVAYRSIRRSHEFQDHPKGHAWF